MIKTKKPFADLQVGYFYRMSAIKYLLDFQKKGYFLKIGKVKQVGGTAAVGASEPHDGGGAWCL